MRGGRNIFNLDNMRRAELCANILFCLFCVSLHTKLLNIDKKKIYTREHMLLYLFQRIVVLDIIKEFV